MTKQAEITLWSFYTEDAPRLLSGGMLALPEQGVGALTDDAGKDALRARYDAAHPDEPAGARTVAVNLLYRFAHEVRTGDFVLMRSRHEEGAYLGEIAGEYVYRAEEPRAHRRSVRWLRHLELRDMSPGAAREISYASASPLFAVHAYADEFLAPHGVGSAASSRREAYRLLASLPEANVRMLLGLMKSMQTQNRKTA